MRAGQIIESAIREHEGVTGAMIRTAVGKRPVNKKIIGEWIRKLRATANLLERLTK